MRRMMMALALMLATSTALAVEGTTRDGFPACRTQQYMEEFLQLILDGDKGEMTNYMVMDKCFPLNGGLTVEVESALSLERVVKFTHQGKTYWTTHLSIRY